MSKPPTIRDLADHLNAFLADRPATPGAWLTDGFFDDLPADIQKIVHLCEDLLVLDARRADYELSAELNRLLPTCSIGPGEQDSHGWLSAVLYTPAGRIVFG